MRVRILFALLLTGAVLAPPAHAATDVAALHGPTGVHAWHGLAVLSVRDRADGTYRLATQRATTAPVAVPGIADAPAPFDADIGPGPDGAAMIAFARCQPDGRCRLARTTPDAGGEHPIAGAASVDGSEHAPAVWGRRLVFARRYASGSERVYVRALDAGPRVRSTRLPGVPARDCYAGPECVAVTDGTVPELDLRGTTLAEVIRFGQHSIAVCGEGQVRLVDITRRTSRLVARTLCGLSGSTQLGVSLTPSSLLFARSCPGDPGGCLHHPALIYRYALRDGRAEVAPQADALSGFAALGEDTAIEVREPLTPDGYCENHTQDSDPPCQLTLTGPIPFQPAASSH